MCFAFFSADDDDDDDGGGFEMELANMEMEIDDILGEGPENQQTNIKWVSDICIRMHFAMQLKLTQLFMLCIQCHSIQHVCCDSF